MFLSIRDEVADALAGALDALDLPEDDLGIEEPPEDVDAVLASSIAYRLAGEVGAPPPKVATDVAEAIDVDEYEYVDAVTTQGPYINFLPSDRYFADTLDAAQSDGFGRLDDRETSVVVEHTSANPTGPVHVGRARNPIIGDALCRVLDYAGYDVDRHYYVNDAGRQIAVFAWAYERFDEEDLSDPERDKPDYEFVRYYRKGNAFLEDAPEEEVEDAEAEIEAIMQGLEAGDEDAYERVSEVVDTVLSGMQETLARLPAEFDEFVKETRFMRNSSTADLVERLKELDQAVYDDEAWQLELDEYGIEKNLVFLRSDGTSLYPTRDLAHHEWKFDNYDRAVTVIGEDHHLAFEQLDAALDLLGNDTDQLEQLFYSWVNLPGGEGMSTREGTGVDLDDLLDEAIHRAREEVEDRLDDRIRDDDLDEDDVERIARQIGIGAVRYDIVAKQPTKSITFEWERALDFEAQSAPYVQYVHARCCGILSEAQGASKKSSGDEPRNGEAQRASNRSSGDEPRNGEAQRASNRSSGDEPRNGEAQGASKKSSGDEPRNGEAQGASKKSSGDEPRDGEAQAEPTPARVDPSLLATDAERDLLRTVARLPAVIEEAAEDLQPHIVATYTRDIAERFNVFYRECQVLGDDIDPEVRDARLALVAAAQHAVANSLDVLGVEAPESM